MDKICIHCGLPIENAKPHQVSHDECRKAKNSAYFREYRAKHKIPKPPKPPQPPKPEKFCLLCGKSLTIYGHRRTYCPECVTEAAKQRCKRINEGYKNARLKKKQAKPKKPKKRKKPVPHCWDLECKSAMQVDIEARALGLTYGKYVSLCDSLFIERYLADNGIFDGLDRIDKAWHDYKKEKARQEEVNKIARANSVMEVGVQ